MSDTTERQRISRLLIVEDSRPQLRTLMDIMREEGFEVIGCATAAEALEHLTHEDLAVAIVDLRLPDLSGTGLLKKVARTRPQVRVIIHTAYGSFKSAKDAVNLAAFAYVEKAGDPVELVRQAHRAAEDWMKEALRESEERYRDLFDRVPVGLYRTTPAGRIVDANPALVEMLGYSDREALLAVNVSDTYVNPEVQLRWQAAMKRDGVVENFQMQLRRSDGKVIWVEKGDRAIRDAHGEVLCYEGSMRDVTERRLGEEVLQQYAKRLEILHEIDQAILKAQSLKAIAEAALDRIGQVVPCRRASIVVFDLEVHEAVVLAAHGAGQTKVGAGTRLSLEMFRDIAALRQGKIHVVEDVLALADPPPVIQALHAEGLRSYIHVPLILRDELIGTLNLGLDRPGTFDPEQLDISREAADSLAVAIQQIRLVDALSRHRGELQRLSGRLASAQEAERKRIARELHDEIGQALTATGINLAAIEKELQSALTPTARERLADTTSLLEGTLAQIRELSLELRPRMLDDLGLVPTLHWYLNRYAQRVNIEIDEFEAIGLEARLKAAIETALYRTVQEALTNVARHAQAKKVRIRLEVRGSTVTACIEDDGRGFDVEELTAVGASEDGAGLLGMRERVTSLGGRFRIESRPGEGTRLLIEIPQCRDGS